LQDVCNTEGKYLRLPCPRSRHYQDRPIYGVHRFLLGRVESLVLLVEV